ncbi:MAG: STAS domain-containing protein [Gaiellaceae bacterium]
MTSFGLDQREIREPAARHVALVGELDLTNAGELEAALVDASADGVPLALDLSAITFVDSAALHVLFRTSRRLGQNGFGLVVPPASPIARTFEIVGLRRLVPVRPKLDELLEALTTWS